MKTINKSAIDLFIKQIDTDFNGIGTKNKPEIIKQLNAIINSEKNNAICITPELFPELLCTVSFEQNGEVITAIIPDYSECTL